jgi:hypothetical protein
MLRPNVRHWTHPVSAVLYHTNRLRLAHHAASARSGGPSGKVFESTTFSASTKDGLYRYLCGIRRSALAG